MDLICIQFISHHSLAFAIEKMGHLESFSFVDHPHTLSFSIRNIPSNGWKWTWKSKRESGFFQIKQQRWGWWWYWENRNNNSGEFNWNNRCCSEIVVFSNYIPFFPSILRRLIYRTNRWGDANWTAGYIREFITANQINRKKRERELESFTEGQKKNIYTQRDTDTHKNTMPH